MFTGVGGFELGLGERFEPVGFSEFNPHASKLLADKWPNVRNYGDATQIDPGILPEFDMLCGGFPCQAFSVAGRRKGFEDTRGTLFFDVARIIEAKRPRIIFLENVKGLLNHDNGQTFRVIIQTLGDLGYNVQWMVLNSKFHGVPQNRERVFIIGHPRGERGQKILPLRQPNEEATREYQIERLDDQTESGRDREANRINADTGISPTLSSGGAKEYKYAITNRGKRECGWNDETSPALCARDYKDPKAVSIKIKEHLENSKERWGDHYKTADEVSPTLMAIGKSDVTNIVQPIQIGNSDKFGTVTREKDDAYTIKASEPNGIIETKMIRKQGDVDQRKTYLSDESPTISANPTSDNIPLMTQVHNMQPRSPDRPSLEYSSGGSGHLSREDISYCVDTGNTNAIEFNNKMVRRLTPRECERLQGFPDDWTKDFSDTQRYKMMGNAVTVNVIRAIAKNIT
jgi:DNA (cytosine-5)-methyltransferase 1